VRTRLRTLYGEAATLTLSPAVDAEGGALVTLVLPISNPDTSGTPAR
jgi:hypothetical protein